jgi:hypothetical protein
VRDASLQLVRKLGGFNVPSKANAQAFDLTARARACLTPNGYKGNQPATPDKHA